MDLLSARPQLTSEVTAKAVGEVATSSAMVAARPLRPQAGKWPGAALVTVTTNGQVSPLPAISSIISPRTVLGPTERGRF